MKQLIIIFISLICVNISFAQDKGKVSVSKVMQKAETVEFTITSTKPFYVGGNIHILHIGKKDFKLSKQSDEEGKSSLTFFIPITDFNGLSDGDKMWLTYGDKLNKSTDKESDLDKRSDKSPGTCWKLGKFGKALLTK